MSCRRVVLVCPALLHQGFLANHTTQELQLREAHFGTLHRHLSASAAAVGERVLYTPSNPISMAMTLDRLGAAAASVAADGGREAKGEDRGERSRSVTFLGSMLWARWVPPSMEWSCVQYANATLWDIRDPSP